MTVNYLTGPALETVRTLPACSVDLVATSPPFLALRNYNDVEGQWGSETNPAEFLDNLLALTDEFGRVLTEHGSIAIELGDTFSNSGGAGGDYNQGGLRNGETKFKGSASKKSNGWPLAKSLTGVPTLYAWSLAYGRNLLNPSHEFEPWRIRNVIVWARSNPPVGALGDKVRPSTSYITVATKSPKRWFDLDAVRTEGSSNTHARTAKGIQQQPTTGKRARSDGNFDQLLTQHLGRSGAPPTDYWTDEYDAADLAWLVNSQPSRLAHYAMWPPKLAERLVLSMCPAEVCRACGEPRRRIIEKSPDYLAHRERSSEAGTNMREERVTLGMAHGGRGTERMNAQYETLGWSECVNAPTTDPATFSTRSRALAQLSPSPTYTAATRQA